MVTLRHAGGNTALWLLGRRRLLGAYATSVAGQCRIQLRVPMQQKNVPRSSRRRKGWWGMVLALIGAIATVMPALPLTLSDIYRYWTGGTSKSDHAGQLKGAWIRYDGERHTVSSPIPLFSSRPSMAAGDRDNFDSRP